MKKFFKIGIFILLVSSFPACVIHDGRGGFFLGKKDSCGFAVSQYNGKGLRWRKSDFPITFYVHESVPAKAQANFISAIDHWNMAWEEFLSDEDLEFFPLFAVVDKNNQYSGSPMDDSYNILFFIEDDFDQSGYGEKKVQAITSMHSNQLTGRIKDTDIIVNNDNYDYFYDKNYDTDILISQKETSSHRGLASSVSVGFWPRFKQRIQNWLNFILKPFKKKKELRQIARIPSRVPINRVDFPSLMIHELGHVPGLAHINKSESHAMASMGDDSEERTLSSVMEKKLLHGRVRRHIGRYDLNNLLCGYLDND